MSLSSNDLGHVSGWGQAPPPRNSGWDMEQLSPAGNNTTTTTTAGGMQSSNVINGTWLVPSSTNNNVNSFGSSQPDSSSNGMLNSASSNSVGSVGASCEDTISAASCLTTGVGSLSEWQANATSELSCSTDPISSCEQQQQISEQADDNNGSATNTGSSEGSLVGEFERLTLTHLLKEEQLDLFCAGWGSTPIDHKKPWKQQQTPSQLPNQSSTLQPKDPLNFIATGYEQWEISANKGRPSSSLAGNPPNMQTAAKPWTPSVNIGGTWGEDTDTSNLWTGVPTNPNNWADDSKSNKVITDHAADQDKQIHSSQPLPNGNMNRAHDNNNYNTWSSNHSALNSKKEKGWDNSSSEPHVNGMNAEDAATMWNNPKPRNWLKYWPKEDGGDNRSIKSNSDFAPMTNGGSYGQAMHSPGRSRPNGNNWNSGMGHDADHMRHDNDYANWQSKGMNGGGGVKSNAWNDGGIVDTSSWNDDGAIVDTSAWNNDDGIVDTSTWNNSKRRPLSRELILASNDYRQLTGMGFKKEAVENALRASNMNLAEALEDLQANVLRENGIDYDRRKGGFNNNSNNVPLYSSINNSRNGSMNMMNEQHMRGGPNHPNYHASMQMKNGGPKQQPPMSNLNLNNACLPNNQMPSGKHLAVLAEYIKQACSLGLLNKNILNQPLNVPSIQFIYQLLQQIKLLRQLEVTLGNEKGPKNQPSVTQSNLIAQINNTKQQIANLDRQIQITQAMNGTSRIPDMPTNFARQQQMQNQQQPINLMSSMSSGRVCDLGKGLPKEVLGLSNMSNPMKTDMSKLDKWKSNDFDTTTNFSRAPGSFKTDQSQSSQRNNSPLEAANTWNAFGLDGAFNSWSPTEASNTLGSLLGDSDIYSSGLDNNSQAFSNLNDLTNDFEPSKAWKNAANLKPTEDEAVNRPQNNALYQNWSKGQELDPTANSFQSTWAFGSSGGSIKSPSWSTTSTSAGISGNTSPVQSPIENAWNGLSAGNKMRGPPPGMTSNKQQQQVKGGWADDQNELQKSFNISLLVRNLSPQMDANILRTLFMQHGPLESFQHNPKNGTAFVKYKNKEDAMKAQLALNNCSFGASNIQVNFASEVEIRQVVFMSQQQPMLDNSALSSNNNSPWSSGNSAASIMNAGPSNNNGTAYRNGRSSAMSNLPSIQPQQQQQHPATISNNGWSTSNNNSMWSFNGQASSNSPWSMASNDRSTLSMQSLLPGDLLNGEST